MLRGEGTRRAGRSEDRPAQFCLLDRLSGPLGLRVTSQSPRPLQSPGRCRSMLPPTFPSLSWRVVDVLVRRRCPGRVVDVLVNVVVLRVIGRGRSRRASCSYQLVVLALLVLFGWKMFAATTGTTGCRRIHHSHRATASAVHCVGDALRVSRRRHRRHRERRVPTGCRRRWPRPRRWRRRRRRRHRRSAVAAVAAVAAVTGPHGGLVLLALVGAGRAVLVRSRRSARRVPTPRGAGAAFAFLCFFLWWCFFFAWASSWPWPWRTCCSWPKPVRRWPKCPRPPRPWRRR